MYDVAIAAVREACLTGWRVRPKNDKRTLYVGGLEEDVTVQTLKAAFIPFGEVSFWRTMF
jgi:RNA recognition motif-containing protein